MVLPRVPPREARGTPRASKRSQKGYPRPGGLHKSGTGRDRTRFVSYWTDTFTKTITSTNRLNANQERNDIHPHHVEVPMQYHSSPICSHFSCLSRHSGIISLVGSLMSNQVATTVLKKQAPETTFSGSDQEAPNCMCYYSRR